MKLSEQTVEILDNFSKINQGIVVAAGNVLKTIHPSRSVIAEAVVPDEFPTDFAIYDLSKFLGAVSLLKDPDYEFLDKSVVITAGKSSCEYVYANPATIQEPPKKPVKMPSKEICFKLTQETFKLLQKAAGALSDCNLVVTSKKGKVLLEVRNTENSSSNAFRQQLEEDTDGDFQMIFEFANLKLLPGDYDVVISSKLISEFRCVGKDLVYWILLHKDSKFVG